MSSPSLEVIKYKKNDHLLRGVGKGTGQPR